MAGKDAPINSFSWWRPQKLPSSLLGEGMDEVVELFPWFHTVQ